jgi:tRNA nucleotidyltransferase/poly(A) polymerase
MPDYMYLLESRLLPEQRAVVLRIQELAREVGLNVYLSGGAVRDLISGMPIRDLDFTVEGNPARMARELEKGGARVVTEDDKQRHLEIVFAGDVDGSLEAARDEHYASPGSKAEIRWATIADDLHRRDFSINAVAISLNAASRGLVLDPMNGLADLERHEVRVLSMHWFTNQPTRMLRALLYCARLGFKLEQRTEEWLDLAISRKMQEQMDARQVGDVVRQFGRESNPVAIIKAWDARDFLGALYPGLAKRKPNVEDFARLMRAREAMWASGIRPRLSAPTIHYLLKRLPEREQSAAMRHWGFSAAEIAAIESLPDEADKVQKLLKSKKMEAPELAYALLAQTPTHVMAFIASEYTSSRASTQIRNYLAKWRPLRVSPPDAELAAMGMERGPKFDEIIEKFFVAQLRGKGRDPEERTKLLRKLSGIKEPPPKKTEKGKAEKVHGKGKQDGKGVRGSGQGADIGSQAKGVPPGQPGKTSRTWGKPKPPALPAPPAETKAVPSRGNRQNKTRTLKTKTSGKKRR